MEHLANIHAIVDVLFTLTAVIWLEVLSSKVGSLEQRVKELTKSGEHQ